MPAAHTRPGGAANLHAHCLCPLPYSSPPFWGSFCCYCCRDMHKQSGQAQTASLGVAPERVSFYCFATDTHTGTHTLACVTHTDIHTLNPSQRHKIGMNVKSKPFKAAKPSLGRRSRSRSRQRSKSRDSSESWQ